MVDTAPAITTTADGQIVGAFAIELAGGSDDNYDFILVNGTLTVGELDKVLSVASDLEQSVVLYPNPTDGIVQLEMSNDSLGEIAINVYDLNGQLVHRSLSSKLSSDYDVQLNLKGLATGVYSMRISIGKQEVSIRRIFKQ